MKLLVKVSFVVFLSTLVTSSVLLLIGMNLTNDAFEEIIGKQQLELTHETLDKVNRSLSQRLLEVQMMAGHEKFENLLALDNFEEQDVLAAGDVLDELTILTGPWDSIFIIDVDGNIIAGSSDDLTNTHVNSLPNAIEAWESAIEGGVYYSNVVRSEITQNPTMLFSAPVRAETVGRPVVGAVIAQISWKSIEEILNHVPGTFLFDRSGRLLASSDSTLPLLATELGQTPLIQNLLVADEGGYNVEIELGGEKSVILTHAHEEGYLDYRGNQWTLLMQAPLNEALAPLLPVSIKLGITSLTMMFLSAVLILLLIAMMLRPIQELTLAANEFARGILTKRVSVRSTDEVGLLGLAFNNMSSKLQELYENLEEKVKEKTIELQKEKEGVEQKVIERTRQLSDEQSRLQASINSLSIGYVMTNTEDQIVLINDAAKNILTLSTPSAHPVDKAIDVREVRNAIDLHFIQQALNEHIDLKTIIAESQQKRSSIILKDIGYKVLTLNLFLAPIIRKETDEVIGTVLLMEDVTEQKIIERSRDEFFSIASHELRTPLTAIRGNASMIEDFFMDQIKSQEVKEMIGDIHESSLRLIDIVNDFLDMSRIEQGRMEYVSEPFDIVQLSKEVVREYDVTGSRRKLYLKLASQTQPIPLVYADKNKIRQIIVNLLGNAIKFTEAGGVTISFESLTHYVKLLVTDTGKGISEENQALLFRKFQQAQSNILTRDNTKGTGLGLYISRLMATSMGGDVVLEKSEVGVGSVFSVTLPIATQSQQKEYEEKLRNNTKARNPEESHE